MVVLHGSQCLGLAQMRHVRPKAPLNLWRDNKYYKVATLKAGTPGPLRIGDELDRKATGRAAGRR